MSVGVLVGSRGRSPTMLRILALFDAPIPAQRALAALAAAGVASADVWSVPLLPGPPLARLLAPVTELAAVRSALAARDVPAELGEVAVEAVRRGAILVVVETPTASAPGVVAILNGAGALEPAELTAHWRAQPGTTYDWAASAPPLVDPPAAEALVTDHGAPPPTAGSGLPAPTA